MWWEALEPGLERTVAEGEARIDMAVEERLSRYKAFQPPTDKQRDMILEGNRAGYARQMDQRSAQIRQDINEMFKQFGAYQVPSAQQSISGIEQQLLAPRNQSPGAVIRLPGSPIDLFPWGGGKKGPTNWITDQRGPDEWVTDYLA